MTYSNRITEIRMGRSRNTDTYLTPDDNLAELVIQTAHRAGDALDNDLAGFAVVAWDDGGNVRYGGLVNDAHFLAPDLLPELVKNTVTECILKILE